jgi:hypothetical protein
MTCPDASLIGELLGFGEDLRSQLTRGRLPYREEGEARAMVCNERNTPTVTVKN